MTMDPNPGTSPETPTPSPASSRRGKTFYSIADLMAMDQTELQSLWDEIPPERQKFYENAYSSALASLGSGDITDDQAMGIIEQILAHYESGQVPIISGNRWVQVPTWVREEVEQGHDLTRAPDVEDDKGRKPAARGRTGTTSPGARKSGLNPQLVVAAVAGTLIFFCIVFTVIRRLNGDATELAEVDMTATAAMMTQIALSTGTPTPFSITDTDEIIKEGEDFEDYYPVLLEVMPQNESAPRVFVVQQKPIEIADWQYDSRNTEVASWISGLLVRPVLGIPYSPDNGAFLGTLQSGDVILLHMSTGTILRFTVQETARVLQQDRAIFRQISPGIVLILLGEPDHNDRLVIMGEYPPQQELQRDEAALNPGNAAAIAMGVETPLSGTEATITAIQSYVSLGEGTSLPEALAYLFVDLEIKAGSQPLDTNQLQFDLTDGTGSRYASVNFDAALGNYPPFSGTMIPANSTQQLTVGFYVPRSISSAASLGVRFGPENPSTRFLLKYTPPTALVALPPEVSVISVDKVVSGDKKELVVTVSVFNPGPVDLRIIQQDFYSVSTAADPGQDFPVGPQVFPSVVNDIAVLDMRVRSNETITLVARFPWDSSQWVGLYILGYEFIAEIQ
jgi:hypothetical protein